MRKRLPSSSVETLIVLAVVTVGFAAGIAGLTVWLTSEGVGGGEAAVTEQGRTSGAVETGATGEEDTQPAETGETGTGETGTGETGTGETGTGETEPPETETGAETEAEGQTGEAAGGTGNPAAGAEVFTSAGCGSCHALEVAGSTGTVGPDLDDSAPEFELVVDRVTNGAGAMPAFGDQLSEQQIADVAAYVVDSTTG